MAIEIEKASISFTDEAELALTRSISRLERRVKARAADLAIKSRGTPAEVTGSDIERAYRDVLRPNTEEPLDENLWLARRLRRSESLHLASMFYMWLGVVTAIVGGVYPYIRVQLADPRFRFSIVVILVGLTVSALGFALRAYARQREPRLKEYMNPRYSRYVTSHKERE